MNTRIQVEHPVNEVNTGINLVQEQFRIASGEPLLFSRGDVRLRGHSKRAPWDYFDPWGPVHLGSVG
jgi:acetyl/propionyl-CoA carboxylase alpha subunit